LVVVILAVAGFLAYRKAEVERPEIRSIAVLPFVNSSNDADTEYLSDGITESTINSLSQIPKLRVMASSTVFTYKGKGAHPRQVGKDLQVDAVVTGNISQRGESLIIRANLVSVADGTQIWGDQYNRKLADILETESEIASQISSQLKLKLSGTDIQRLQDRPTENTEAYKLYLQGRYHWNKRSEDGFRKSIEYLQAAIEKDPSYARAYAGLADSYALITEYGFVKPDEGVPKTKAAAEKSIELDPNLAEPHTSLAWVKNYNEWDPAGAEREFKRSIELNPNYPTAHQWYGYLLATMGRSAEAISEMKVAQNLDPLSLIINDNLGYVYAMDGQYEKALEQFKKTLEINPNFGQSIWNLGYVYMYQGKYPEALRQFEKLLEVSGDRRNISNLITYYAMTDNKEEARKLLDELIELSHHQHVAPSVFVGAYAAVGNMNRAFEFLDRACDDRDPQIFTNFTNPAWDNIRSDPRYKDFLRRVNLSR